MDLRKPFLKGPHYTFNIGFKSEYLGSERGQISCTTRCKSNLTQCILLS